MIILHVILPETSDIKPNHDEMAGRWSRGKWSLNIWSKLQLQLDCNISNNALICCF